MVICCYSNRELIYHIINGAAAVVRKKRDQYILNREGFMGKMRYVKGFEGYVS